ncbi:hypothetical protein TH0551_04610 [Helicobacter pylori]
MFENQMDANGNYVGKKFSAQAYDNKTPYKVATGNASERSAYLYSKKLNPKMLEWGANEKSTQINTKIF